MTTTPLYTETIEQQWLLTKPAGFSVVKADQQTLSYLIEYLKLQHQQTAMVRHIRGRKCIQLSGLMNEWAAALQFPLYFGGGLNAWIDCMQGLPRTHQACVVVIITEADLLLTESLEAMPNFWEALAYVVQLPQEQVSPSFRIILQASDATFEPLQTHLQQHQIIFDQWEGDWANLYMGLID